MKKRNFIPFIVFALFFLVKTVNSQQVAITDATSYTPKASALLDIHSNSGNMGLLIPQVTLANVSDQTTINSPANGLMVFHTGTASMQEGFYFWSATDSNWKLLYSGNVPSVPGNTVYWVRPTSANYIQPEGNDAVNIYDDGQTYGIYYNGNNNVVAGYFRTTNSTDGACAVQGFSDVSGYQTNGYLGYNASITVGASTVGGAAVHGEVNDPSRIAVYGKTTGNASVSAIVGYSNTWMGGYYYIDDADTDPSDCPSALYAIDKVSTDKSCRQPAVTGWAEQTNILSDLGTTVGGQFLADGYYQEAMGVYAYGETSSSLKNGYGAYCIGTDVHYGKNVQKTGIGIAAKGSLIGQWTKGDLYGMNVQGERYSLYVDGKQYTNDVITELHDNGNDERIATYVPTSMTADIYMKGIGTLINGKAHIEFDKQYTSIISSTEPVYITVTPLGQTEGIYLSEVKSKGFDVAENNDGKSNVKFTWIAIATKKGYEKPNNIPEILAKNYDENMRKVMNKTHSDVDHLETNMYWDGKELKFHEKIRKGYPKQEMKTMSRQK